MNFKRILTSIIALVLVTCLIVNVSPVKASAASFSAGVTGWQALLYFLMVAGGIVVSAEIPTEPPAIIQQAEEAFDNHLMEMYEFYFPDIDPDDDDDTDLAQFWEDLKEGVNECIEKNRSLEKFPDYLPEGTFADWLYVQADSITGMSAIGIGAKLDQLLASWFMDIYESGTFDVTNNLIVEDGYALYNGAKFPALSDSLLAEYPYCIIGHDGGSSYRLLCSRYPFQVDQYGLLRNVGYLSGIDYATYFLSSDSTYWAWNHENFVSSNPSSSFNGSAYCGETWLWSSYDLFRCIREGDSLSETDEVVFFGSPVIYSDTELISYEPDSFFGDYVDKKENGTLSSSDFQFPLFDFKGYINDQVDIQDQMQQLHDQIQNGQISYDDYMQSVSYDDSINDNIGGDSSETPGDSSGGGSDNDYLTGKVNALLNEFSFARSIVNTAKAIKTGLAGVTIEPPVIYIHLENNRGSYNIGGTVPFLDLRWYAEYKPTVDALISAFLWICFAWKMLLKLPGIISGVPGDFVMDSVHHIGMSEHMPVRKAEYEVQRVSNRHYIRRGKDG